jgi:hypothetical protein
MKKQDIKRYGVCRLSLVPIWLKPDTRSILISQVLLGESIEVVSIKSKHWVKIKCLYDQVIGFADPKQFWFFDDEENEPDRSKYSIAMEFSQVAFAKELSLNVLLGSTLTSFDGISFYLHKSKFSYSGQAMFKQDKLVPLDLFNRIIRRFLMAPECKGGRSVFGIDSSAFVQLVFKIFHIQLPRYAYYQVDTGTPVLFNNEAKIGDLVFCESKEGMIDHVGIIIGNKRIMHVHGHVRIDKLDQHGIFNLDERRYTHRLRIIKRIDDWLSLDEVENVGVIEKGS